MKSTTLILPCAVLVISIGAAVVYVLAGDWRRALYWFAAAVITICVTF